MPNEALIKVGTALTWKSSGGDAALTVEGLASGAGRQGAKLDLATPRANRFLVRLTGNPNVAPVAGATIDVYWAGSSSATAGTDNPGGCTGADAAFTDADLLKQLEYVGSLSLNDATGAQTADVGVFTPKNRYGMPVIWNASAQALNATAGTQALTITPIVDEIQ